MFYQLEAGLAPINDLEPPIDYLQFFMRLTFAERRT